MVTEIALSGNKWKREILDIGFKGTVFGEISLKTIIKRLKYKEKMFERSEILFRKHKKLN